jgi:anti-sigma factor RsiW
VTCDVHVLTGVFVTDALDEGERHHFSDHLHDCPSCAQEVRELRETAALLGIAAGCGLPSRMRTELLRAVEETRQVPPPSAPMPKTGTGWARRPRPGSWRLPAAASLLAVIAGLGTLSARHVHQLGEEHRVRAQTAALATAPDARALNAHTGPAAVTVEISRRTDRITLAWHGMPTLPRDRTYQVWLVGPAATWSPVTFTAAAARPVLISGLGAAQRLMITDEPAGGSLRPTTPPVITMDLPTT